MTDARPWVVQRPFKFGGRDYLAGQRFDWSKVGCTERRLRQLADLRRVAPPPLKAEKAS